MMTRRPITNEDIYAALVAILAHLEKQQQPTNTFKQFVGSASAVNQKIENIKRQLQSPSLNEDKNDDNED